MEYKIVICDDEEQDIRYISSIVGRWSREKRVTVDMEAFPSAESFLFYYAGHKDIDILLLDIEMKAMNGVELARRIRQENDAVQIIFITGFPDFMPEGYEVSALHYLLKPVSADRLLTILSRAADRLNKAERSVLFAVGDETVRAAVSDIVSAEASAHSCMVTTVRAKLEVKSSISVIEKMLSEAAGGEFIRCHRSYIVSVRYIKSISKTEITLDSGAKIPLSRNNYQAVNQAFIRYFKGASQWE